MTQGASGCKRSGETQKTTPLVLRATIEVHIAVLNAAGGSQCYTYQTVRKREDPWLLPQSRSTALMRMHLAHTSFNCRKLVTDRTEPSSSKGGVRDPTRRDGGESTLASATPQREI